MALTVYLTREEVPSYLKIIDINDEFFDAFTRLTNTEFEKNLLDEIDKAKYASSSTFYGRTKQMGALNVRCLSTGTKTLLNIEKWGKSNKYCFNVIECGDNALEFICDLHSGSILFEHPYYIIMREDESCDIECRGIHFRDICEFIEWAKEVI